MAAFDPKDPSWLKFRELYRGEDGELETSEDEIRSEYEGLIALAEDQKIEVGESEIELPTGKVYKRDSALSWANKNACLGRFVFVYYPRSSGLKVIKLDPKLAVNHFNLLFHGWSSDEGICLGNLKYELQDMIKKREFLMATSILIEFLETGESL